MSCHSPGTAWTTVSRLYLPHLSKPQATVLALWSLGMVLARSCALTAVATFLAVWRRRQEQPVRHQLREFCDEAEAKRGDPRQALGVERCFVPLLAWVLRWWQGTQLALALEATPLGTRFTVLATSVGYRGGAIPVAWTLRPANQPHAWRREWLRLLRMLRPAIPTGWTVIGLADRGLDAGGLFRRIIRLGWPPCLRINAGGPFRPAGQGRFYPLRTFTPQGGTCWHGTGTAFKSLQRRLNCTLLACWEAGYTAPWLILTALPPEASDACWYGLRAWLEQGFNLTKRAGWPWQRTRMTEPQRAARLWLAVAVATLWLLSVGGGRRGDRSRGNAAGSLGGPGLPAPAASGHPLARAQYCSPRLGSEPGGLAEPGPIAAGDLLPRTLADPSDHGWSRYCTPRRRPSTCGSLKNLPQKAPGERVSRIGF